MKMLIFALFIFNISSSFALSQYKLDIDWGGNEDELTDIYKKKNIEKAIEDGAKTYGDIAFVMYDALEELYFDGYVDIKAVTFFKDEMNKCAKKVNNKDKCDTFGDDDHTVILKDLSLNGESDSKIKGRLKDIVKVALKKSDKVNCALPGEIANVRQCCQTKKGDHKDLIKGKKGLDYILGDSFYNKKPMIATEQSAIGFSENNKDCSEHNQCATGVCNSGKCAAPLSCYQMKKNGDSCNDHPYCDYTPESEECIKDPDCHKSAQTYMCLRTNHTFAGVGECKDDGSSATSPSECCSNKITGGKCVADNICGLCKRRGEKPDPAAKIYCCPGMIEGLGGKCIMAMPPFILDSSTHYLKKIKTILQKIIGIESAHAEDLNRIDHAKAYDVSKLETKTGSNVQECEFNTNNDYWVDADPKLKNANTVLRAFEVTYSGKGTNDYQTSAGKGSVFERAHKISTDFRIQRKAMRDYFTGMDNALTCKCIHLLGPVNSFAFKNSTVSIRDIKTGKYQSYDKKDYYTSQCSGVIGTVDAGTLTGDGMANIDKIDSGAIGISHEKVLIEWLKMRRDAQADLVENNVKLEDSLTELSEFVTEYPWYGEDSGTILNPNELYSFRIRYMSGLAKWIIVIIVVIVAVVLSVITFGGATAVAGVVGAAVSAAAAASAAAVAIGAVIIAAVVFGITSAIVFTGSSKDPLYTAHIEDIPTRSRNDKKEKGWYWKGNKNAWYEYDQFKRVLKYPYYDNTPDGGDSAKKTQCKINGSKFQCLKSAYLTGSAWIMKEKLKEVNGHPFIDPLIPLTTPYTAYETETYGVAKRDFVVMVNEAFVNYLEKMKKTYPRNKDGTNRTVTEEQGNTYEVPLGTTEISWGKKKYLDYDPMTDQSVISAFKANNGSWDIQPFNSDMIAAFKTGVEKYAKCKELKPVEGESCIPAGNNTSVEEGAIGFGYYFENDQEIKDFIEYTYQLHFLWPHLSFDGDINYPLMGQDAYFQLVAGQMQVINDLAFRNMGKLNDLIELYEKDLADRIGNYGALNSSATGTKSIQSKYTDKMWGAFKGLNFSNNVNMAALSKQANKLANTPGLSASDSKLLAAMGNHAFRRSNQQAKRDNWNKKIGNTERGKNILKGANEFLNKFTSPLGNSGGNLRATSPTNPALATTPSVSSSSGDSNNTKSTGYKSTYNPSYSSGSSGYEVAESLNKDLSDAQASHILDSAQKEDNTKNDGDSLFIVVSKAYRRNLDRVLVSRVSLEDKIEVSRPVEKIDTKDKEDLKKLLETVD